MLQVGSRHSMVCWLTVFDRCSGMLANDLCVSQCFCARAEDIRSTESQLALAHVGERIVVELQQQCDKLLLAKTRKHES